jgi:hypothetical protein
MLNNFELFSVKECIRVFASTFKSRACHRDTKAFKRACKKRVPLTMTKKLVTS